MPLGKTWWTFTGLFACIFLLCFGGLVFFSVLPRLLQNHLLPAIIQRSGLDGLSLSIRKLDLFGLDLANIHMGGEQKTGLTVDTVKIDFSPKTLLNKQVKVLSINGVDLFCEFKNGSLVIPGILPWPEPPEASLQMEGKTPHSLQEAMGFGVETLNLLNVRIFIPLENRQVVIPLEATLQSRKDRPDLIFCTLKAFPFGQEIHGAVEVDLKKQSLRFDCTGKDLSLNAVADLFSQLPGLAAQGRVTVAVKGEMGLSPLRLGQTTGEILVPKFQINYQQMTLKNTFIKEAIVPMVLHLDHSPEDTWRIDLSTVALSSGSICVFFEDLSAGVSRMNGDTKVQGHFAADFEPTAEALNLQKQGDTRLCTEAGFDFTQTENHEWAFNLENTGASSKESVPWVFMKDQAKFSLDSPLLKVTGTGTGEAGKIQADLTLSALTAQQDIMTLTLPSVHIEATGTLGSGVMPLEARATLSNMRMTTPDVSASFPTLIAVGQCNDLLSDQPRFKGNTSGSNASVKIKPQELSLAGINLSMPLAWPSPDPGDSGQVNIRALIWGKKDLGPIKTRVRQKGMGILLDGKHQNRLIPGMVLKFSGHGGFVDAGFESGVHYELVPHEIQQPLDLGRIFPQASGFTAKGNLSLWGDFEQDATHSGMTLTAGLKNGGIYQAEQKISMEGIETEIFFPNLFQFKTAPRQGIVFQSAALGNIIFENGLVEFQMESPDSFFIEKTMFKWCNGHVETQALRISPDKDEYDLVLYCDRLNLAMILMQFGAAEAEGKGTVNGRIPLAYTKGRWTFNDGFLYSSPGEGGRIKIQETEQWAASIPVNTPQFDQIQMARETVKNYEYNWAKVSLHTVGNDLMLSLNFNGQPAKPIPFAYQQDAGKFIQIKAGEGGGIRPEVFLDLNFKLPLNEVLHYREFMDMIQ
ncbi:MAG: YdbH domain-containing protein [Proteobacteria bacterium]|nr:YdbH domain-containing protein [Pseudomonadota bacterium]